MLKIIKSFLKNIKRIFTSTVTFDNVLGVGKYEKETQMPLESICVLGAKKL